MKKINQLDLGWISFSNRKSKILIEQKSSKDQSAKQLTRWIKISEEDFTLERVKFDKLRIDSYLSQIKARSIDVFPYAYDTCSHWFYYVLCNSSQNKVTIKQNKILKKKLKELKFSHGVGDGSLKTLKTRHPMPNLSQSELNTLKKINKSILSRKEIEINDYKKMNNAFRKIWIDQISDNYLKRLIKNKNIEHLDDILKLSIQNWKKLNIETQKAFFSIVLIRSLYYLESSSDQKKEYRNKHKSWCDKTLKVIRVLPNDVVPYDMKNLIEANVIKSRMAPYALWHNEARLAVKNLRPVFKTYRLNAFFKILRNVGYYE